MTVNLNALFKEHGINIKIGEAKGLGIPVSQALLDTIDIAELNDKTGRRVVAGDMLTAVTALDENGQVKLDDNGRPKRAGGYLKLGVDNDLSIMIPRAEPGLEPYELRATNSRHAAAQILRMAREARHEVAKIAEDHAKAMEAHALAIGRGEQVEAPVAPLPKHDPDVFKKFDGFVAASEAVIASELRNAFSTVGERTGELMASLSIRNERRNVLTPDELAKVAEARSLRERIGQMDPTHAEAAVKVAGSYRGNGEAAAKAVEALSDGPIGIHCSRGVPAYGAAATLIEPLFATFTTENPANVYRASISGMNRRRFEQEMGRFESEEIAETVRPRIEAVMGERMPGYGCDVRFFAHKGADMLMVNDLQGAYLYVMDSAARTADLDLEALNRAATPEDVPTDEELAELRSIVQELTFDNGADIDFAEDEPEAEDEDEILTM